MYTPLSFFFFKKILSSLFYRLEHARVRVMILPIDKWTGSQITGKWRLGVAAFGIGHLFRTDSR